MTEDSSIPPYTDPELYDRNVAVLARWAPRLRSFTEKGRCNYTIRKTDAGVEFFNRAGESVLGEPDPVYSEKRTRDFIAAPFRLAHVLPLQHVDAEKHIWIDNLGEELPKLGKDFWFHREPDPKAATMLVVIDHTDAAGLQALLSEYQDLAHLFFFVRDIDLFMAGLHVFDWSSIVEVCIARKIKLYIRTIRNEIAGGSDLVMRVTTTQRLTSENVLVYAHIETPIVESIKKNLQTEFRKNLVGVGFFRDEIEMLLSAKQNLVVQNRPLICPAPIHDGLALVVGSGPSLDDTIEIVRHYSENAFVIACGTAVEPLLSAGVRVDITVVLERGEVVYRAFRPISERVDLSEVRMVASATVHPDVESLFKEAYYFFRPGLNIRAGFKAGMSRILHGCDPTVSNTGLALAYFLGFRQAFLFGVDVGSIDRTRHHSRKTVYETNSNQSEDTAIKSPTLTIPVPASFGGKAYTNWVFQWAGQKLEDFCRSAKDLQVVNVSDGGRIEGVPPVYKEAGPLLQRLFPFDSTDPESITIETEHFDRANYNYRQDQLDDYIRQLRAICARLSWHTRDQVGTELEPILFSQKIGHPFQVMVRGTLAKMIWSTVGALGRMTPEERACHEPTLRQAIDRALQMMREEIMTAMALPDEEDDAGLSGDKTAAGQAPDAIARDQSPRNQ